MRLVLFALLALSLSVFATLDQEYVQNVSRNGSSTIQRTTDVAIFANQLTAQALQRMADLCAHDAELACSVDVDAKRLTMSEGFTSGGYHTYITDYGFPFITHTFTVSKVPTDKFSDSMGKLAQAAGVEGAGADGSASSIDLNDDRNNKANADLLRSIRANITYTIIMPIGVSEAKAGKVNGIVSGNAARFDLVEVIGESEPIVITSRELNLGYLVAVAGILVLVALAVSFFGSRRPARRKK